MADKQVKDYDKFNLRFPDGMRETIAERAKRNGRSMNSEIIQILQDAIEGSSELSKRLNLVGFIRGDREIRDLEDNASKLALYIDHRTQEFKQILLEDLKLLLNHD
ncbi:Arc family DNA-binding protein [Escherichia coli]|uniref:Arc family DNA-binding protein n=1 Tax=Escherichia coli TaxID=562 RepID=UPI00098CE6AE|nr:Arc family DNA-binding protein [Escherichia coli]HAW3716458.1 Arc family DNA-binding protein [Escherichia coli]